MPARENRKGYFAYMLSFYSDVGGATLCVTLRRVGNEGINGGSDGLKGHEAPWWGVVVDFSDDRSQFDDSVDGDYFGEARVFFGHKAGLACLEAYGDILVRNVSFDKTQQTRPADHGPLFDRRNNRLEHNGSTAIARIDGRIDEKILGATIVPIPNTGDDAVANYNIIL